MQYRLLTATAAVAALVFLGGISTAGATIIGAKPNTGFTNASTSFSIGSAQYTLSNDSSKFSPLSISTGGSGQVSLLGTPPNVPHVPDGVGGAGQTLPTFTTILGPRSYSFDSFPDQTTVPTFSFYGPYLGLKFTLDDGIHYGYAKITDSGTLVDYAYNSDVGAGITTGAAIEQLIGAGGGNPVPEPSSLAMLGLGLLLLIGSVSTRRRFAPAHKRKSPAV